jgi:hypothetical protein
LQVGDSARLGLFVPAREGDQLLGDVHARHGRAAFGEIPRLAALPAGDRAHLRTGDVADEFGEDRIGERRARADPFVVLDCYLVIP